MTIRTLDRLGHFARWWVGGTALDWGFTALGTALVAAGYYDAWINRHLPAHTWEHAAPQAAWLAITVYLFAAGLLRWRRDKSLETIVPEGYGLAVVGCAVFLAGILISGWWATAFGDVTGVPAVFRPPNLLQIAGGALIVSGPLRASAARGELMAGPTAVLSAVLLLAAVTFFTQFDHPYIDLWASERLPLPGQLDFLEEELGALSLIVQTAIVTGVILWVLRQSRLPVGSIMLMLTGTAFLVATQKKHFEMVLVAMSVGVLSEVALLVARPRPDRMIGLRLFAVCVGALLSGVYLADLALGPGTWWRPDMIYGTVLACALVGGLMSYVVFPGVDASRAAMVLWPALNQDSLSTAPDVTVERVEHALKVLQSTRDLEASPLMGLRAVASPTAASLRHTIEAAIEQLRTSSFQLDAQAGEILSLYYVRRIGGHYPVSLRVGLSRAAYFNRRSYGVRRLVDGLRELEESSTPA